MIHSTYTHNPTQIRISVQEARQVHPTSQKRQAEQNQSQKKQEGSRGNQGNANQHQQALHPEKRSLCP